MEDDDTLTPNTLPSDSAIDFNLMDQLLHDGFWLEATTNGSSSNPASIYFPVSEAHLATLNTNPLLSGQEMDEFSVKKRLEQAINCLKDSIRDKDVLIQIWIPVNREGRQVLTTNNQPFLLDPNCKNLADYRVVSQSYHFAADEESKEFFGLPGRVFLKKSPEWTPDVRFFKIEEYPRVSHAQLCDVKGSLALPVFEQGSGVCLGVAEIVTMSQKVDYRPEIENICKALEAVDLKSSNILTPSNLEDLNKSYQATLTEIRNVLKFVCDTHKLPLAQTWSLCAERCKDSCRHSDQNDTCCISTVDSACYVADPQVSGFHEACSQHHLLKGEGLAGKAFLTNKSCFAEDVTAFSKTEYPLAHHARVFNLSASGAIRLRSIYNGTADFVLEFFLPPNCKDADDQMHMLHSISSVIQLTCQCLHAITDQELAQETSGRERDPRDKGKGVVVSLADHEELEGEFKVTSQWDSPGLYLHYGPAFLVHDQVLQQDCGPKTSAEEDSGNFSLTIGNLNLGGAKTSSREKRRTKNEKNISLQVLRQYFAGSLKEAAKNIGVCPTTLKRICRQHGITRWPSRKIKKVGHSLRKLQRVIDSVEGAQGSIQLSSFYNNFPELISPNAPWSSHMSASKMSGHDLQQLSENQTSKSPSSSGGHSSSSSSYCCSTGVKQSSFPGNTSIEEIGGVLKRAKSDAKLHEKVQLEGTKPLVRSYSHKVLSDQAPAVAKNSSPQVDHVGTFRVKAGFGSEKIRFSLQPTWGFEDLQQEVLRRFKIDNGSSVNLKYLDDDDEWVLLTCDADLQECKDVYRSSRAGTIKLSVNQA